jgi:imidazoleglycerol-phosphate dehydratase
MEWKKGAAMRRATVERKTKETDIRVELVVDGKGKSEVATGIGFLDHMLEHIAVHGLFDLTVQVKGDTHVDLHHTVEDTALALGEALDRALGDRRGLVRIGSAVVPMDETLAMAVVDFSGRPHCLVRAEWALVTIGELPATLVEHFFRSFSAAAKATVHVRLLERGDDHHQAEAMFKAFGRALDRATQIDPRRAGGIPSSKGVI